MTQEEKRAAWRAAYARTRERRLAHKRAYYLEHKDEIRARNDAWIETHRDQYLWLQKARDLRRAEERSDYWKTRRQLNHEEVRQVERISERKRADARARNQ